jgi:hypothetical protein
MGMVAMIMETTISRVSSGWVLKILFVSVK